MGRFHIDESRDWNKELRDNGHIVQLHGNQDFITHSGLLYVLHRLFHQVHISTECTFIDRDKKIAEYRATITVKSSVNIYKDDHNAGTHAASEGTYIAHGDACPQTCNRSMAKVYKRFAETRAINRAIRLIVGGVVGLCSLDEMDMKHKDQPATKQIEKDIEYQDALEKIIAWSTHHNGTHGFTFLSDYINNVFHEHPSRKHLPNLLDYKADQLNKLTDWLENNKSGITDRYEEFLGKPTQAEIDMENRMDHRMIGRVPFKYEGRCNVDDDHNDGDPDESTEQVDILAEHGARIDRAIMNAKDQDLPF